MHVMMTLAVIAVFLYGLVACSELELHKIEGKLQISHLPRFNFAENPTVLANGGQFLGLVRDDGSFVINGVPAGQYLLEVDSKSVLFDRAYVEVTLKGRHKVVILRPDTTEESASYPVKLTPRADLDYFQKREGYSLSWLMSNPMLLMAVVVMGMGYIMPKMMDPEAMKELQQQQQEMAKKNNAGKAEEETPQLPFGDGPSFSQRLADFFEEPTPTTKKKK
eukprot:Lithocolla_globosa_v1_NODE_7202_length_977_cov_68.691224.p1 type:complete len:221 gc:universal NODE_7202_length_977_cov_68.691224:919-257(-)